MEKATLLTSVLLESKAAKKDGARWKTKLQVQVLVGADGAVEISTHETGGVAVTIKVPAL